jgi:uncharacterized protein
MLGEEKTFSEIAGVIQLAKKANPTILRMLGSSCDKAVTLECSEDIRTLEKQGDRISFRVKEDIVNGAVSPNVLDNLLSCVELADGILDNYYFASREIKRMMCVRFADNYQGKVPELDSTFSKMLKLADDAFDLLINILMTKNVNNLSELRNDIQLLEEEGDNIKDSGFDKLYAAAPNIHFLQFSHSSELLHKFDDILDSCEDIADLVVEMITSISK